MSYILEALRKAEQERKLGQPPSLQAVMQHEVAEPRPPRRRLLWIALTIAVLLLLAVMTLLLLRQRSVPAEHAPPATPAAVSPADAATAPAPAGAALPQDIASLDDLAVPQPPAATKDRASMETMPVPRAALPAAPRPAPPPVPQTETESVAEPEIDEASDVEAAMSEVPLLREMPPNYRADFPALSVEVHVYDEDPARRWIMTGGKRYREGEALSEGPRIAEITPEGIVFDHRGQRALVPITR